MSLFADEGKYPVETVHAPKRVESAVTSYRKGIRSWIRILAALGG